MADTTASENERVSVTERTELIPTYEVAQPNPFPMYLENRVYQGSSGVVYPHPVIDKISDRKTEVPYRVVYLENDYLKVMVLPELGGRIQMAYDKVRDYHFIYYNRVIKPALVGLTGPWVSGGIEFNWPQHHRPSTFDPVQYRIERQDDGSVTLWVGELERMFNTFGSAGITLHPDKAVIEIKGRLYNPTPVSQTFLWWANPAVSVNDSYQAVFPPDVHAVFDHGKRAVSEFPIAKGTYYKVDYSRGVDISWYKNVPVPTSYMAYHSDFDFVGGYDHDKQVGLLHVADHRVAPGKKMWTWGNGDFSRAWERHLTDEDGPYIELMTGVFTDNQPDFCWIMSGERKEFTQYFFPYAGLPKVSCANERMVLGLELVEGKLRVTLYSTAAQTVALRVVGPDRRREEATIRFQPGQREERSFPVDPGCALTDYRIEVVAEKGETILEYREGEKAGRPVPQLAMSPAEPGKVPTVEELYYIGTHLEQYRHARRNPEAYYGEGLARDAGDVRCNCAMGWRRFRQGDFSSAVRHFRTALGRLTRFNPNPVDTEAYRGLGLALFYQDRIEEALEQFTRCAWNGRDAAWGWYWAGVTFLRLGRIGEALDAAEKSSGRDASLLQARLLAAEAHRRRGDYPAAMAAVAFVLEATPLYFHANVEAYFLARAEGRTEDGASAAAWSRLWDEVLGRNAHTLLEVAFEYHKMGNTEDAVDLVCRAIDSLGSAPPSQSRGAVPLLYYAAGWFEHVLGREAEAASNYARAEQVDYRYCFPNKIEFLAIFDHVRTGTGKSSRAAYYQGCLLYGVRRYEDAHAAWASCAEEDPSFAPAHRNLAVSFFNKKKDCENAEKAYRRALETAEDARLVYEFAGLQKRLRKTPTERLSFLEAHRPLLSSRDDLTLEYAALLNVISRPREALDVIKGHTFHPWEGGEGSVSTQYRSALIALARDALVRGQAAQARLFLEDALDFPENLGESRLPNTSDNEIRFFLGFCASLLGESKVAAEEYELALRGESEPALSFFYNDTPADALFYRGLALGMLGRGREAAAVFESLISFAAAHRDDAVEVDFFAVSLPDLEVFGEDLGEKNRVLCCYLAGLGQLGKGLVDAALRSFADAAEIDPGYLGMASHLALVRSGLWDGIRGRMDA